MMKLTTRYGDMLSWGWLDPVIATASGERRAEGVAGL
jgi:hypothetical protein